MSMSISSKFLTWKTNLFFIPWTDRRPFIRYMSSLRFNNSVPSHMLAWKNKNEISSLCQVFFHTCLDKDSGCNWPSNVYLSHSKATGPHGRHRRNYQIYCKIRQNRDPTFSSSKFPSQTMLTEETPGSWTWSWVWWSSWWSAYQFQMCEYQIINQITIIVEDQNS